MQLKTLILCSLCWGYVFSDSVVSLVVSTTESLKEGTTLSNIDENVVNPKIYAMDIQTNITNRFATTLVTSKVRNLKNKAAETTFSVVLPEYAFISHFEMEIEGKVYKAYVKEKKEAKQIYDQAVSQGQSAGHVELSARDSKTFTVSVNIEPESKTIFRLIYEELLQRQLGNYELVVNIHPGQIVDDLNVAVYINETRPLTLIHTPSLRTGNEISKNDDNLNPLANIEVINHTAAIVQFHPDVKQQKEFAQHLGGDKDKGLAGQFIVQYDVERDPQGGEVLVRDGYFVHFFSPLDLKPLKKHVVFVLDHSGSMSGRKIAQLTEAMQNILSQLTPNDLFDMVRFSNVASVWNVEANKFDSVHIRTSHYGNLEPELREYNLPDAVFATEDNIQKAKTAVKDIYGLSMTNIIAGLEVGLHLIKRTEEKFPKEYQPMIIFLTDGMPNVGVFSGEEITKIVSSINTGDRKTSIFSLSFGAGADKKFLRNLSTKNLGFSRHIFEASDSSLQLEDFYRRISSPLLSNVTFKYVDAVTDVTITHYPILFNGSELVVAGRTSENVDILENVIAICPTGPIKFKAQKTEPISSLERLWAYLTVQQLLKEKETVSNKTDLTKKALDLALKYSFVTSVSSLVVVKPNKTDSVDSKDANPSSESNNNNKFRSRFFVPQSAAISGSSGFPSSRFYSSNIMPRLAGKSRYNGPYYPTTTRRYSLASDVHLSSWSMPPKIILNPPAWIENIKNNNDTISTSQGDFKFGNKGDSITNPPCSNTPSNTTGVCTIVFDCPQVYAKLTDLVTYLKYFCPLNEYAGVCCPEKQPRVSNP